ncbi:methyltransferase domain-containing protein [Alkalimarinus coralli]|uniref:methyltransferase domain-containing protein n=1 Tax=Alkalimarinus coralli TaxID=2935863 RepID=UPI00202B20BE|nr:methyltransferase domain-containing protein [Alkalimarinus coralli]
MSGHCKNSAHSRLLEKYFDQLKQAAHHGNILDMACGAGRNGLFLANNGLPVTFADKSETLLDKVTESLSSTTSDNELWHIDLEKPGTTPFKGRSFSSALVFRYLHRPLIEPLKHAILPGGIIIYETFTIENRQFGRPDNPDFLLKTGELRDWFNEWETLHYFEGILSDPDRAIAQIVCRKPMQNPKNKSTDLTNS